MWHADFENRGMQRICLPERSRTFGTWLLFTILIVCWQLGNGERLDVTTVYRFGVQKYSDYATMEIHAQTNALGLVSTTDPFIHTDTSRGMDSLHCLPANSNCKWKTLGNWDFQQFSDPYKYISHGEDFFPTSCSSYNNNCQVYCYQNNNCECPSSYRVDSRTGKCYSSPNQWSTYYNQVVEGSKGKFSVSCGAQGSRLLIVPHNSTLKMKGTCTTGNNCGTVSVASISRKGQSTQLIRTAGSLNIKSKGRAFFISFSPHYSLPSDCYSFTYESVLDYLTLQNGTGTLSYDVGISSHDLCVSLLYKAESENTRIEVSAFLEYGHESFSETCFKKDEGIIYCRYKISLPTELIGKSITVGIVVHGYGQTVIYGIRKCNPYRDVDIIYIGKYPSSYVHQEVAKSNRSIRSVAQEENYCYNGGILLLNSTYNDCQCPAGFTGKRCEEGCGPNRYGNDCGAICSNFQGGCRGMVFCKKDLPCLCAPGFKNEYCNEPCTYDFYGAGCYNKCGKCRHGTCNPYTGKCETGCESGYFPPLCQDTLKYTYSAPSVYQVQIGLATITSNTSNSVGRGSIKFCQLQYKEEASDTWTKKTPGLVSGDLYIDNATDLNPGRTYETRVVCVVDSGDSYEGNLIPTAKFTSLCSVPISEQFIVSSSAINRTSIKIALKYKELPNDCPLRQYEIFVQYDWENATYTADISTEILVVSDLLPGKDYELKIRGIGDFIPTPYSSLLTVTTDEQNPSSVRLLSVVNSNKLTTVSWTPPSETGGEIQHYIIKYECLQLLACHHSCKHSGHVNATNLSVQLQNLKPHAQYVIQVAAQAKHVGPFESIYTLTEQTDPDALPESAETPVIFRTNSSFAVAWSLPENCSLLNGYFAQFRYELRENFTSGDWRTVEVGTTKSTNATFQKLLPLTTYFVHVYVVTSAGWNPHAALVIPANTASTVSEAVRDLVVYKRGRRMLGVRWAAPARSYGEIKSFLISYKRSDINDGQEIKKVVDPQNCLIWPDLFCYSLEELLPNKQYQVTISVRNKNVDADGTPAHVNAKTNEGAPTAPMSLAVKDRTPTKLTLKWGPPFLMNGIIRSFLVNVEQIDTMNTDDCCEYFPVVEVPVSGEQKEYFSEVTGLVPASTYVVSVSAKTVTLGPSTNITVSVPPQIPRLQKAPEILNIDILGIFNSDTPLQVRLHGIEDLEHHRKSTYLLIVLTNSSPDVSEYEEESDIDNVKEKEQTIGFFDHDLSEQMKNLTRNLDTNGYYYVVSEFTHEQLEGGTEVPVGTGKEPSRGTWSILKDPKLEDGTSLRLGLALVLEYAKAKSIGLVTTESFTPVFHV